MIRPTLTPFDILREIDRFARHLPADSLVLRGGSLLAVAVLSEGDRNDPEAGRLVEQTIREAQAKQVEAGRERLIERSGKVGAA